MCEVSSLWVWVVLVSGNLVWMCSCMLLFSNVLKMVVVCLWCLVVLGRKCGSIGCVSVKFFFCRVSMLMGLGGLLVVLKSMRWLVVCSVFRLLVRVLRFIELKMMVMLWVVFV